MFTRKLCSFVGSLILTSIFWSGLATFLCLSAPFCVLRKLLDYAAQCFHPEWRGILLKEEAVYADKKVPGGGAERVEDGHNGRPSTTTNVMLLAVIASGEPNLDKLRNFFREYVLNYKNSRGQLPYEKFFCYIHTWLGYSFWKRARSINLNYHIRYFEEFAQKSQVRKDELEVALGDYNWRPFPWKTPLWEILVVKNFVTNSSERDKGRDDSELPANYRFNGNRGEPSKFVLIFRWHHALADGYSICKLIVNILGGETPTEFMFQDPRDFDQHSVWKNLQDYAWSLFRLGSDAFKLLALDFDRNVWRVEEDTMVSNCHLVASNKLPYNLARTVSNKRGVSITTVLFTAVAGGIRNYFMEAGQQRRIPQVMRVRIPLQCDNYKLNDMNNCRSFTHLSLPVGQPNAWKRLYTIHKSIEKLRRSFLPGFVWLIGPTHASFPNGYNVVDFVDKRTTMTGWHFAGPKQELLLLGEYPAHEILCYHPRLQTDAAIGLAILSYNGTIRFSVCIDKTLFPHRESALKLVRLIELEFLSLQELKEDNSE